MRRLYLLFLFLTAAVGLSATPAPSDSTAIPEQPTLLAVLRDSTLAPREKLKGAGNIFMRFVRAFDEIDTNYITPNRYNWAFMMQNTNAYEFYSLRSREDGQRLSFSPRPSIKIGPYLGWRWIFLGYTFDVASFGKGRSSQRTEFELSLYSSMLGCDLIYRRTGDDFRIHRVSGFGEAAEKVEGHHNDGIRLSVTGANVYYIFNHKRFSYPAAFAQSTVQRKSCGTWKLGASITRHLMKFDHTELPTEISANASHPLSESFKFNRIDYMDYSISAGYAYNWVFRRNWLLCVSLSPAIGYKKMRSDKLIELTPSAEDEKNRVRDALNLDNFNLNTTLRIGLVWNTTKYFGGLSFILHNYNYRHSKLNINNAFGTLNFYAGLNFQKRKEYR